MTNLAHSPEIWETIPGYEGYYQASTHGRIRSLDRMINGPHGKPINRKGKILTQHPSQKGYLKVKLQKEADKITRCVHTLVAAVFIPNLRGVVQVNHKDGNRQNNCVDNLEWCTNQENQIHKFKELTDPVEYRKRMNAPTRLAKISAATTRGKNPYAKKVIDTVTQEVFGCVGDAADKYGYTYNQLKQWLNGRRKNKSTLRYL